METESVGEQIARLRTARKLSRRALGELAGVSHEYIGEIERGEKTNVSAKILDRIAQALGKPHFHALAEPDVMVVQPDGTVTIIQIKAQVDQLSERQERLERIMRGELAPRIPELGDNVRGLVGIQRPTSPVDEQPVDEQLGKPRDVYLHGAAGKADEIDFLPQVHKHLVPPPECAGKLRDDGYGVEIRGESLADLGIHDGMVAWANPITDSDAYSLGDVVVALCWKGDEAPRIYVKQYAMRQGTTGLWSLNGGGKEAVKTDRYQVIARVVCVSMPPMLLS